MAKGNKGSGTGNHKLPGESKRGVDGHLVIDHEDYHAKRMSKYNQGEGDLDDEIQEREDNLAMFGDTYD